MSHYHEESRYHEDDMRNAFTVVFVLAISLTVALLYGRFDIFGGLVLFGLVALLASFVTSQKQASNKRERRSALAVRQEVEAGGVDGEAEEERSE